MEQNQQEEQQQQSSQTTKISKTSSEPQNPFSPSSNETSNQDQDMRISLNQANANDKLEIINQDIDMRILALPHRSTSLNQSSQKYKNKDANNYSKNTQDKANEQNTSSRKLIDYSQYLKDANIDLNQSDMEDPLGMYESDFY